VVPPKTTSNERHLLLGNFDDYFKPSPFQIKGQMKCPFFFAQSNHLLSFDFSPQCLKSLREKKSGGDGLHTKQPHMCIRQAKEFK